MSDIHGNNDAFEVAIRYALESSCEVFLICGDIVGYYYDVSEIFNKLSNLNFIFVKGNHEQMLSELRSNPSIGARIRSQYGSALDLTLRNLTGNQLDFLCSSPNTKSITFQDGRLNLSHGSPWNINEYLYPDCNEILWSNFMKYEEDIFVVGNTHHQMIKRFGGKIIINPGSVGQSRTDKSTTQWAEFDSDTGDFVFRSKKYDSSNLLKKCLERDPEVVLLRKFL